MPRTAIIDADVLVYSAALSVEYEWEVDESLWLLWSDLEAGIARLESLIHEIREHTEADQLVFALSDYDSPNWRGAVYPEYKKNRSGRRPIIWRPLREYLEEVHDTYIRPTLEGDDVIGILMTHPTLIKGEKVCVTIDKDLRTVPGLHFCLKQAQRDGFASVDIEEITLASADRFHLLQTIAGDRTDGVPGVPGFGMKKAAEVLDAGQVLETYEHTITRGPRKGDVDVRSKPGRLGDPWEVTVSVYQAVGLGEEAALMNARLVRICRAEDYDFKKKRVKLWTPR